eukprot:TRINITY_DN573_c0_g1_i3.p2 TRINITY_DN573_c0_g1~~TRINITY_DN573_c0_g1_i3.p2  ORF type:complete len:222 (-),score=28.33 TRINITY_DN573_c0_g1_i3:410-1075(-)
MIDNLPDTLAQIEIPHPRRRRREGQRMGVLQDVPAQVPPHTPPRATAPCMPEDRLAPVDVVHRTHDGVVDGEGHRQPPRGDVVRGPVVHPLRDSRVAERVWSRDEQIHPRGVHHAPREHAEPPGTFVSTNHTSLPAMMMESREVAQQPQLPRSMGGLCTTTGGVPSLRNSMKPATPWTARDSRRIPSAAAADGGRKSCRSLFSKFFTFTSKRPNASRRTVV